MKRKLLLAGLIGSVLPLASLVAQEPKPVPVPPGAPVTITVTPAAPAVPDVSISLLQRTAHVTPNRTKCTHTGGGNIDVQQPSPDTVIVTMTGAAVAYGTPFGPGQASLNFDLAQCFEVSFDKPTVKAAKLTLEGRVIGLLRSHCKGGSASENGCASVAPGNVVTPGGAGIVTLSMPGHSVADGECLSVNDHEGPVSAPVTAGKYVYNQTWTVEASMPRCGLTAKAPSAEFAPDPALDPLWISYKEPFHGAAKKDFGFQVIVKVAPEEVKEGGNGKEPGKVSRLGQSQLPAAMPITVQPNGRSQLNVYSPYGEPRR